MGHSAASCEQVLHGLEKLTTHFLPIQSTELQDQLLELLQDIVKSCMGDRDSP